MALNMEDIPDTGSGTAGRVLATEIKQIQLSRSVTQLEHRLDRLETRLERLFWVVLAGSLSVAISVIGSAIYVGGQFQAIRDLDRRVTRIEDRPTLTAGHAR